MLNHPHRVILAEFGHLPELEVRAHPDEFRVLEQRLGSGDVVVGLEQRGPTHLAGTGGLLCQRLGLRALLRRRVGLSDDLQRVLGRASFFGGSVARILTRQGGHACRAVHL